MSSILNLLDMTLEYAEINARNRFISPSRALPFLDLDISSRKYLRHKLRTVGNDELLFRYDEYLPRHHFFAGPGSISSLARNDPPSYVEGFKSTRGHDRRKTARIETEKNGHPSGIDLELQLFWVKVS